MFQNIAVVGTIAGIFLLYFALLLVCRKIDKKDKNKVVVYLSYKQHAQFMTICHI